MIHEKLSYEDVYREYFMDEAEEEPKKKGFLNRLFNR